MNIVTLVSGFENSNSTYKNLNGQLDPSVYKYFIILHLFNLI